MKKRGIILFFAAATGYISLTQEMFWFRAIGYATGSRPDVFAHTLGFFLAGVAIGAFWGEKRCAREGRALSPQSAAAFISAMLLASALVCYLAPPVVAWIFTLQAIAGLLANFIVVAILSCFLGAIFPVLCHYGIKEGQSVGIGISHIYGANIVGSTLGPLLTGFVLMEYLTTAQLIAYITLATLALAAFGALLSPNVARSSALTVVAASVAIVLFAQPVLYDRILEKLHTKAAFITTGSGASRYKYVLENRHGVISVLPIDGIDNIFGNGAYDGMFAMDPVGNDNGVTRAYMIAAIHPNPKDVLEIGISGGAWTRIMCDYAPIKHFVAVEINPAYLDVMKHYPEIASILEDPKLTIHIDDGRRWLKRNPEPKFDLILQNTTWHWRSNITNLLSTEYLELCKAHLKPAGVMYFNTTDSEDVAYTTARVFKYVVRYNNFVAGSDSPFALKPDQIRHNLLQFLPGGKPVFGRDDPKVRRVLADLSNYDLSDKAPELRSRKDLIQITDDNMATEFKDKRIYEPRFTWNAFFNALTAKH